MSTAGDADLVLRGRIFTPLSSRGGDSWQYLDDGVISIRGGRVELIADAADGVPSGAERLAGNTLLTPGFVDLHLHAPQLEMIGSYGGNLMDWLESYTFPTEARFADPEQGERVASILFPLLLTHGTTTALIFSSVHTGATEAFFQAAERSGIRAIIGKTMMDCNAPEALLEPPEKAFDEIVSLIESWNGVDHGRIGYAITPRFAPTSSAQLLATAGKLVELYPEVWVQTHISENEAEIELVRRSFSEFENYASVYDHFGLLTERTILAHGVHLTEEEIALLAERNCALAHCPNSNLFLGSGLFPLDLVRDAGIRTGLGSDIGAGTSPSMLGAMADTYKVQQVRGISLSPFELWHLATLGGARSLGLDGVTGSLEPGKDADMLLLDLEATPLISARCRGAESIEDMLSACIFLGDDRLVQRTWVRGKELTSGQSAKESLSL